MSFFLFIDESGQDRRESPYPVLAGFAIELEASKSIRLSEQMHRYFRRSEKGRMRASQIVPEPLFVHSEMTSGVQVADLLAYTVSWGFRMGMMHEPRREELAPYVDLVCALRHRTTREIDGNPEFVVWSFCWIDDLRTQEDLAEE